MPSIARVAARNARNARETSRLGAPPTRAPSILALRTEVSRLREGLDRLDAQLARLAEEEEAPAGRVRPERYYLVLLAVYERGPHGASTDELATIGAACDYDRRGLGGYFAGKRAPLRSDGGRVRLTVEGNRLVREYLDRSAP
jgi:hypothetical protein